jgi:hypothetical protein
VTTTGECADAQCEHEAQVKGLSDSLVCILDKSHVQKMIPHCYRVSQRDLETIANAMRLKEGVKDLDKNLNNIIAMLNGLAALYQHQMSAETNRILKQTQTRLFEVRKALIKKGVIHGGLYDRYNE